MIYDDLIKAILRSAQDLIGSKDISMQDREIASRIILNHAQTIQILEQTMADWAKRMSEEPP